MGEESAQDDGSPPPKADSLILQANYMPTELAPDLPDLRPVGFR